MVTSTEKREEAPARFGGAQSKKIRPRRVKMTEKDASTTEKLIDAAEQGTDGKVEAVKVAARPEPSAAYVLMLVIMYATCSSTLSVVNKWALLGLPFPGVVTACQFQATAVTIYVLGRLGFIDVDPIRLDKMRQMAPINVVFYMAIFTNGQVLKYSTVETFIAFRSLTPLLVAALDTVVRGEPPPSKRTMGCLLLIALGAASYARDDANFTVRGYAWACVYLAIIVTEMVYAKHVTATINLSTWGLALYQNVIALFIWPVASFLSGEFTVLYALLAGDAARLADASSDAVDVPDFSMMGTLVPILVSCVLAVGISFSAWGARSAISATQFTVLGVACKLATVAINVLAWSHHASASAQASIVLCIVASVLYQQSAKRDKAEAAARELST